MKISVVGASGLIGTKVVELLKAQGHDVEAASRSTGLDVLTGAGLRARLDLPPPLGRQAAWMLQRTD